MLGSGRALRDSGPQRFGRLQQPLDGFPERRHRRPTIGQLTFGVGHRARQHVQLVVQRIEFGARHDQFVFTDLQFAGPLTPDPVPLPTRLTAEFLGTTRPGSLGHHSSAISASWDVDRPPSSPWVGFRHDEIVSHDDDQLADTEAKPGRISRQTDDMETNDMETDAPALPEPPLHRFASDNNAAVHPLVLEALSDANVGHAIAYGDDPWTSRAAGLFCDLFGRDVESLMVWGGTGANVLALATLLTPAGAVVCSDSAHINVDETGAPERILGSKLIDVPHVEGKITPELVREFDHFRGVVHHVQPSVLSITQSTEWGTLYTADEIAALADTAHSMGMKVHLDGARIANATAALGGTVEALRSFTVDAGVDVVSFGGTKNGAMYAEAVVYLDPALARSAPYVRKQITQLPSKMRYVSAQFVALLSDDLWLANARHANDMCRLLHRSLSDVPGVDPGPAPAVNSIYPSLDAAIREPLRAWSFFYDWSLPQVRWMTAWDTRPEDVAQFVAGVRQVAAQHL